MDISDEEVLRKYYRKANTAHKGTYGGDWYDARWPSSWNREILQNIMSTLACDDMFAGQLSFDWTDGIEEYDEDIWTFREYIVEGLAIEIVRLYAMATGEIV